jgi:Entner-Doudoroff aldolase
MTPEDFVEHFREQRASAILRTNDETLARNAMNAAVAGGFRVIEFTMSIPNTTALIREFSSDPKLTVGAGTVLTCEQVDAVIEAGARFVVSPVVDVEVIKHCVERGVACMPGCRTPTEMFTAYRAGAQLQKLFPQTGTGPMYVKHCLGPLPFLKIVPTSGVTLENVADYLAAGAHAVGFVATLFTPDDLLNGNFQAIEDRSKQIFSAVK